MAVMPGGTERVPTALAVTGGAGAVGLHFIRHALEQTTHPIRVLVHRTPLPADLVTSRVTVVRGSLLDAASLDRWLCPGAGVVHLAWSLSMTAEEHRQAVASLAAAAVRHEITRLVHCSTAVVAGRTPALVVTEDTPCEPMTDYERAKYDTEMALGAVAAGRFPLTVLRPTAVFGPGLQNLLQLMQRLRDGRRLVNYARASLFGCRHMHLVPVETVVGALLFAVLGLDGADSREEPVRYIVSADDEPGGDFRTIETRVRRGLQLHPAPQPLRIPAVALRLILKAAGRSDTNPQRIYDGVRLRRAGFVRPVPLGEAIDRYVHWYRTMRRESGTS